MAFCILSVIRKQWLKQCNYSVDQSALLSRFRTDFTSSVWNLCRWVTDVPTRKTSPAAKIEEKRMLLQARVSMIKKISSLLYSWKFYLTAQASLSRGCTGTFTKKLIFDIQRNMRDYCDRTCNLYKKSFICFRKYFENNSSKIIKSPRHIFSMHVEHVY